MATVQRLANGVRVVTAASGAPSSAVSVLVRGGVRSEGAAGTAVGVHSVLARTSFMATASGRSALRLNRELELSGARFTVAAERECLRLTLVNAADDQATSEGLAVLADVLHPRLQEWEVLDAADSASRLAGAAAATAEGDVDALHAEAYRNAGLGVAVNDAAASARITRADAVEAVTTQHVGANVVVVGAGGIDAQRFADAAANAFGSLEAGNAAAPAASPYVGGDSRRVAHGAAQRLAIAFEGVAAHHSDAAALAVLRAALGDACAPGAPGPRQHAAVGTGAGGILGAAVRDAAGTADAPWLHAMNTFNYGYSDSGLFGVSAVASPEVAMAQVGDAVLGALKAAASGVSGAALDRAKGVAKRAAANSLGDGTVVDAAHAAGDAVLAGADPLSVDQHNAAIDAVSADDVRKIAATILKSKPTILASGDVAGTPTAGDVTSALN